MGRDVFQINLPAFFEKKITANFKLDEKFFKFSDSFLIDKYLFDVVVVIEKKNLFWQLDLEMKGVVNTYCDRCGDSLLLRLEGGDIYYIKEKSINKEVDNVIFITRASDSVDIKNVLIETLFFLIPKRRVHQELGCDVEVLKKIDSYKNNKKLFLSELFKVKKIKNNKDGTS